MKYYNKIIINKLKASLALSTLSLALLFMQSCEDYLDVVPDNVATIDNAFKLRNEAEKYLFSLYSYLPKDGDVIFNIGMLSGDEMWIPYQTSITSDAFEIARGNQRISNPYMNVWEGTWTGGGPGDNYNLFEVLRNCNTFIENMNDLSKVPDIESSERKRWIGEAEFLKAYYHYYLLRMYGPIPIIDKNVPIDAPESEINVSRDPVDECVAYIVDLLDSATEKLPNDNELIVTTEAGRLTKTIALSIKAKVLLMAASPLFNGNSDFASLVNRDGTALFNPEYDENKWKLAADAALEAIQSAHSNGKSLYVFPETPFSLSETTMTQMSIRQAVCERWNEEIIWANPNSRTWDLQRLCMPPLIASHNHNDARKIISPPLKIARMFYTKNGVPINEDNSLEFFDEKELREATSEERFNIKEGYLTARLNYDREPRFYADLGFDGGIWYKYDSESQSDEGDVWYVQGKFGDPAGASHAFHTNVTGYFVKKLVDWNQVTFTTGGATYQDYAWPEMRLADLYLMYAEALNEADGPSAEVYEYLDLVRERAGLDGVVESWANFSVNPTKPTTKNGLREIIHRERLIELAFEGHRFWDLRRWKKAAQELNAPITGWNIKGEDNVSYYQIRTVYQQSFVSPRDYFWPIPESQMLRNLNLVQNLGW
ncbi:RagB/SusD family nutrient uptake outer membrane protein [Aestuariibaculum sediminum]|uniref:RagB/SusD family nutrient uptake outer membrane protein n=1 Tax=Aestuariibaculum sediminum TaxID=2770637 RepID=A0A8J6Q665_9FLAO|nr:RagB/SusD family nutrient uptake outer membrane protein [Aestuariibaculum sediminum]MBD0831543.1 RagB/SusD family nutrient uptake outer membrane protein [Aestuariibaculum sediminum]